MGRYACSNLKCLYAWHVSPTCPYARPEPRPITESERAAMRHLRQLERDGILEMPDPGIIPRSWLWAVPLGVVIFVVLVILI